MSKAIDARIQKLIDKYDRAIDLGRACYAMGVADRARPKGRPDRKGCNCEKQAPAGFLTSFDRQDGEQWKCPRCGQVWVHVCDEAEGCAWYRQITLPRRATTNAAVTDRR